MEKKKVIFLFSGIAIVIFFLFIFFYNFFFVLGVKNIDFSIKVGDTIGLNVDTDKLYFGTVPRGGTADRGILVKNEEHSLVKTNIKVQSDIKDWLYVNNNNFFLKKDEKKDINFKVKVPLDAEYGEYDGQIILIFTRF